MNVVVFILFIIFCGMFGWFCGDVVELSMTSDKRPKKWWLGFLVWTLGILMMWGSGWLVDHSWKTKEYNSDKYEIVRDSTLTNRNGQIDTTATFRIIKVEKD